MGLHAPLALAPGHQPRDLPADRVASEEETIDKAKPDAEQALRREAVLAAVAEAESLEPTEEEMLEAVSEAAPPGEKVTPKKLLERLKNQRAPGQPQGRPGAAQGAGPGGGVGQAGRRPSSSRRAKACSPSAPPRSSDLRQIKPGRRTRVGLARARC